MSCKTKGGKDVTAARGFPKTWVKPMLAAWLHIALYHPSSITRASSADNYSLLDRSVKNIYPLFREEKVHILVSFRVILQHSTHFMLDILLIG